MYQLVVYSDNFSKEVGKYFYFDTAVYVLLRYPSAITGFKIELV